MHRKVYPGGKAWCSDARGQVEKPGVKDSLTAPMEVRLRRER